MIWQVNGIDFCYMYFEKKQTTSTCVFCRNVWLSTWPRSEEDEGDNDDDDHDDDDFLVVFLFFILYNSKFQPKPGEMLRVQLFSCTRNYIHYFRVSRRLLTNM